MNSALTAPRTVVPKRTKAKKVPPAEKSHEHIYPLLPAILDFLRAGWPSYFTDEQIADGIGHDCDLSLIDTLCDATGWKVECRILPVVGNKGPCGGESSYRAAPLPSRVRAKTAAKAPINHEDHHRLTLLQRPDVKLLETQKSKGYSGRMETWDLWRIEGRHGPCFVTTQTRMIILDEGTRYMMTSGDIYHATEEEARASFTGKDRELYQGIADELRDVLGMG